MPLQRKDQSRSGAAMAGSGAVVGGTGLVAGGIPGAKEPNSLKVWHLRGNPRTKSWVSPANLGHNARIVAPLPRSGILGFRADMHDAYIKESAKKKPGNAYVEGVRSGKLDAEKKIVRGMRTARKATHGLTFGGAALGVAGLHRMQGSKQVKKRDTRQRGAVLGTAGAAAGGVAGGIAGIKGGVEAGAKIVNHRIDQEYPRHLPRPRGDLFVRQLKAVNRGGKVGALVGTGSVGTGGYLAARGKKVTKRDSRANTSAAALGAGGTLAGVGHVVPKGLDRFSRGYSNSAKDHVLQAQQLAPHFGGLKTTPAKVNGFGVVVRHPKTTMHPVKTDRELAAEGAANRIKTAKTRAEVGRHRGIAAQERHFAEVFDSTSRAIRRVRGPGLALAGAGAAGVWANHDKGKVRKAYGYQENRTSPLRATEAAIGITLAGWGGSRLGLVKSTLAVGSRRPGNVGILASHAEKARAAIETSTGRGAAMLGQHTNTGLRLRPTEGAIGGAVLANHAMPVRRKEFTPVRAPMMQGGY